jgi:feruloyl-CoA synthase
MRDCVITGHDRDDVGMMAVPDLEMCRRLAVDLPHGAPADQVLAHHAVQDQFRDLLKSFAQLSTGSANRVTRLTILAEPPSLDAGEMTDKGSLNQRAILTRRKAIVESLYAAAPGPGVLKL